MICLKKILISTFAVMPFVLNAEVLIKQTPNQQYQQHPQYQQHQQYQQPQYQQHPQYQQGQACTGPNCQAQMQQGQSCGPQGCGAQAYGPQGYQGQACGPQGCNNGQQCNQQACGPLGCQWPGCACNRKWNRTDWGYSAHFGRPYYESPYYESFYNNYYTSDRPCDEFTYPYDGSGYYSIYPYFDGF